MIALSSSRPATTTTDSVGGITVRFSGGNRGQDLRHERTQVVNAVAARANQYDGDGVCRKVLLELQVLVHRDEHLKLSDGLPQQRAVLHAGPAKPDDGLCLEFS